MKKSNPFFVTIIITLLIVVCFYNVKAQPDNSLILKRVTGFAFAHTNEVDTSLKALFHQLTKTNALANKIGLPIIGDTHFNDYRFVDPSSGILKHNYFLVAGEIFPSLYLFDNKSSKANIKITFGLKIRVWNNRRSSFRTDYEPSHAVKTPSFMPGIYYSRLIKSKISGNTKLLHYIEIGFAHHSNGQDAPTLVSQDSTLNIPGDVKYNIEDGNFSANNLSFGYYINKVDHLKYKQQHSIKMILDGMNSQKFEDFDLHRYKLQYSFHHGIISKLKYSETNSSEKHRFGFTAGFGVRSFKNISFKKSFLFKIEYNHRIEFLKKVYLLFEYNYLGQDDYNIYLEHSIHHFRIGLSNFISMKYL